MESSGKTTRPAPAAWARREKSVILAAFPAKSPTVGLICPRAIFTLQAYRFPGRRSASGGGHGGQRLGRRRGWSGRRLRWLRVGSAGHAGIRLVGNRYSGRGCGLLAGAGQGGAWLLLLALGGLRRLVVGDDAFERDLAIG